MLTESSDWQFGFARELLERAMKDPLNEARKNANVATKTVLRAAIRPPYVCISKNVSYTSAKENKDAH
jgi:hypothetical protein